MWRGFLVAVLIAGCTAPDDLGETHQHAVAGKTVISLTFDDTFADMAQAASILDAHSMHGTFFVNSSRIGTSSYMTLNQLLAMQANGHEIAGHTIDHPHLTTLSTDDQKREICNDRASLLQGGFRITSFAYPFSDQDSATQQIVAACGYNSARLVGGLVMPNSCNGCPYANTRPPEETYAVRTNDSVKSTTTLDDMKLYVTQAEQHGGGWVPIVMHHVCNGCDSLAVSPAQLTAFLDWLQARSSIGTVVATVDAVMGGTVKPSVDGPIASSGGSAANLVQNPSLEADTNADQIPDCWQRGGTGTNSATYTLTSNAYDGNVAQRIDVTSLSSGARRLVTKQDTGACAPPITAGHTYKVTARYLSNTQPIFTIYYRNSSGSWVWFAQSSSLPSSSSYTLGSYTTPALPSGATAISVGLSIVAVGSLTMDAFSVTDTAGGSDTAAPSVSLTAPASGSTVSGIVQVSATASDAGGVAKVEFLANGSVIATDTSNPYWIAWDTSSFAGRTVTLAARATDTSGNAATSSTVTVTVPGAADTTPPTVALTAPAAGATVSGSVQVTANASDAGGVARVEFYAGTMLIGTDTSSPYAATWDTTPYAGTNVTLTARAYDTAGNTTTSAARTVTVSAAADTTPPTVALTSPANGATVTGTVTLSADAADAGGIAKVEFYANGTTLIATELTAPYSLDWDTTPYAGTTVTLTARAYDNAGNTTTSAARTVTVSAGSDTTPPSVSVVFPADGSTVTGTVEISVLATDNIGVARVEFYVNGALLSTDTTAPYKALWDTPSYAGTTATLTARGFDTAGNATTSAAVRVTVGTSSDPTPPTVTLVSPADGATVGGDVQVRADASDNIGIQRVEFWINDQFSSSVTQPPYITVWNTQTFVGQTVTIFVRAYDTAENATQSATHTVTVVAKSDLTAPTVALTSPADGANVSGTITLSADASDNVGIARVDFFANNERLLATELDAPYSASWDTAAFSGQTITVTARAVDTSGNQTVSAASTITVAGGADTTPPTVALTSPADNATVSGTVTVTADASDAGGIARVEFYAGSTLFATDTTSPYSASWNTSPYAGTSVSITARAFDTAGNSTTSAARTVTVAAATTNLIKNASLETDANGDQVPDCWQRGGSGTNAATYTLTSNAYAGSVAQRIDMTSYTSGAKRIVTLQDSGTCAPAAVAGHRYTVTAHYIANAATVFTVYYRSSTGTWTYLAQSPTLSQSSSYATGTWTTPAMPSGATHISIGLSITALGSLTQDDFTLIDAGP